MLEICIEIGVLEAIFRRGEIDTYATRQQKPMRKDRISVFGISGMDIRTAVTGRLCRARTLIAYYPTSQE